jgi:hypothetical protein
MHGMKTARKIARKVFRPYCPEEKWVEIVLLDTVSYNGGDSGKGQASRKQSRYTRQHHPHPRLAYPDTEGQQHFPYSISHGVSWVEAASGSLVTRGPRKRALLTKNCLCDFIDIPS